MRQTVIIAVIALSVLGCRSKRPAVELRTETHYVELVRDSTIIIPADSAWLEALLECDSLGNVYMKQLLEIKSGTHIKPPIIQLQGNMLSATSQVDSFGIYHSWVDRYGITSRETPVYIKDIVKVPVRSWIWWVGLTTVSVGSTLGTGYIVRKSGLLKWIKRVFKII